MVSINRNIVGYNKYVVVITLVVVLLVIFIFTVISLENCRVVTDLHRVLVLCAVLFSRKCLIVLSLFQSKYRSEYLLCR